MNAVVVGFETLSRSIVDAPGKERYSYSIEESRIAARSMKGCLLIHVETDFFHGLFLSPGASETDTVPSIAIYFL
jgi:hypothetical protein